MQVHAFIAEIQHRFEHPRTGAIAAGWTTYRSHKLVTGQSQSMNEIVGLNEGGTVLNAP